MNKEQRIARGVGILYIIGTAAGILSVVFLRPFQGDQNILAQVAADPNKIVIGSLLILVMGLALAMVPVLLYPIFKKTHEVMALGAVLFRGALEGVIYSAQALLWLLFIPLSQALMAADAGSSAIFNQLGQVLLGTDPLLGHILSIVFSIGGLMIYYVFYQTRLIPRWLSIWGLVGGVLYIATPLLGFFGIEVGFLMLLLAVQEMAMALWLIIKGFNSEAIAA